MPENNVLTLISKTIKKNKTFFIAGHKKPDGDTVGSALALASLIRRLNKKADVCSGDILPDFLQFLPDSKKIKITTKVKKKYDCAIILECSDLDRMGSLISKDQAGVFINIDHHAVHNKFGDINYIDPKSSSTAEQVYRLFKHMKIPIKIPEAQNLYAGLVTDTGKFQYSNTTPSALNMAAELIKTGVKTQYMSDNLYANNKLSSLLLLSAVLNTLRISSDGKVATMKLTNKMYADTGANTGDSEGIINYAMTIPKVIMSVLFGETKDNNLTKISMRSRGNNDVSKIAKHFGGGGHKNAAGFSMQGAIENSQRDLLDYLQKQK